MGIEQEIGSVEIIENIDDEGTFQIAKHRGVHFQITVCGNTEEIFFKRFSDNYIGSEKLQEVILCEVVVFLGEKVPQEFRGPVLAHEIAESIYDGRGYSRDAAHAYGVECERIYAEKFLDENTRQEFLEWAKRVR